MPVEEWGREAGEGRQPIRDVLSSTVPDSGELWDMVRHTHLAFLTPGTG